MKTFWDQRYAGEDYAYGTEPNAFFRSAIDVLPAGKILLPGEGEGRNAIYAASIGWDVHAIDQSRNAGIKALKLAGERGLAIHYHVGDVLEYDTGKGIFDAAGLVFFHLPSTNRQVYHKRIAEALKTGGTLIIEAFHKKQLNHNSGGPKNEALLYTGEMLLNDFEGFETILFNEGEVMLDEGPHHQGVAHVIRYIGRKQ